MISRQEAAELLDCNVQTVTNWVERGLLKGHTIGRALMVDRESIHWRMDPDLMTSEELKKWNLE